MAEDGDEEATLNEAYPASRQMPAIYVNNFYVTGSSTIIRIAFGESANEPPGTQYRTTVAMPLEDARELVRVVAEMIAELDEEAAAEKVAE
jgi:hypothetical protein